MTLKNQGKKVIPKLFPLLFLLLWINTAGAQTIDPDRTRVSFPQKEIMLSEAFLHIQQQTPFRIAFTGGTLDTNKKVRLPKTEYTVTEAVERLLSGTGYTYTHRQLHFVIVPQDQPQQKKSVAVAAVPQRPVRVDERELVQYVPERQHSGDSVAYRTVEAGPFVFNAPEQHYPTPGDWSKEGQVPMPFLTADRWQRSKFALKTNLLYGGVALAPNLRAEFGLGNRTTLEIGASYNGWNLNGTAENNRKLIHGIVMPEFRYWLCERFSGHFFGVHGFGAVYNVGGYNVPLLFDKDYRYQGTAYGGGISYGYMLPFAKRWAVEFNVGVGVAGLKYDKYGCDKCDELEGTFRKTYFGPTRAGVTFVFLIK